MISSRRWPALALVGAGLLAAAAHAQTPSRQMIEQRCDAALPSNCGSCSAQWPAIARCVANAMQPRPASAAVAQCIADVNRQDWPKPMAYDRVSDVVSCVARKERG
jgi:hypothetical protein